MVALVALSLFIGASPVEANQPSIYSQMDVTHPVWAQHGMVASQERLASEVGVEILRRGGNAVDAAVAVGFALAVTLPRAGNLGGGGFMVVHLADSDQDIAIDYREMAPGRAHRDMFLDEQGDAVTELSRFHGLAVGVPGTVYGLDLALSKYGTMSLKQVLAPAIALAEEGILVSADLANSLEGLKKRLGRWPSTEKVFYKAGGGLYAPGDKLVQRDLAASLKRIADGGRDGFYKGETARLIAKAVQQAGGVMTEADLANYRAVERQPVRGEYRGYEVISMPPPSSGGVHIIQMLNMLEHKPMAEMGAGSAQSIHWMAETMRRAYADRSEYLGDPDFTKVPVAGLTSRAYAAKLLKGIDPSHATPSSNIKPGNPVPYESDQTTHYSVVDKWGNAVSNTYTLNFSYGSGLVAEGTGILLNNEMDDFSAKPGTPNGYGLIGGEANEVQPGKRPLSSMSPTIVMKAGKPYLVTGSPGGSRIISTTLQVIVNVIDHDMNVAEATAASRIHHQWYPDEIRVEKSINPDTKRLLETMGHKVSVKPSMGSTQSIMVTEEGLMGASDPRRMGAATLGY
ncbi:gamma-glutamyltransferase [Ferrimonas sediminicola]|uniref:Glutathione hydrolase proenzyme n=1 Tax=Ferrimonas sediminicola TaxID=2569538 RepID=A0A4U1BE20_9GAMM|nr:gamma-glutamyltransferase [Ferrimonas sediminicola]TKB48569.1 gamma-glutamyltransferase [Ferrimonas sediminicola]